MPTIDSGDSPNWDSEDNDSVDLGMTKTLVETGDYEEAPGVAFKKAVKKSLASSMEMSWRRKRLNSNSSASWQSTRTGSAMARKQASVNDVKNINHLI